MWSKRLNYLILILVSVVGLLFYHNYAMMLICAFLCFAVIFSFVLFELSYKNIEFQVEPDKNSIGKNISVKNFLKVKNDSWLTIEDVNLYVTVKNNFYENEEKYVIKVPVLAKNTTSAELEFQGRYCGVVTVKIEKAEIYDLFGIFKKKIECNVKKDIFVIPSRKDEFDEFALSTSGNEEDDEMQYKKGDDVSQVSQIRDYIPGDNLSNIHWKLSAKNEEIQVKEFSMPFSEDVVLLLEMYNDKEAPGIFDEIIEVFNSVSRDLIIQHRKFSIVWMVNSTFEKCEINNEDEYLETLKEIYFTETASVNGMSYENYRAINPEIKGTLLYISNKAAARDDMVQYEFSNGRVVLSCLS